MPHPAKAKATARPRSISHVILAVACACFSALLHAQAQDLGSFLRAAEVYSPVLHDLGRQTATLALDSADVRAALGPRVNGSGQAMYAPSGAHWGYDPAITNGGLWAAMVGAQLPLFAKGRRHVAMDSIAMHAEALVLARTATQLDLRRTVTDLYISAYADQRLQAAAMDRLRLLTEEDAVFQHLVGRGIYQEVDRMNLRVNIQAQRIAVAKAEAAARNSMLQLKALCGIVDTAQGATLADPDLQVPAAFNPDASPGLRQFTVDSLANALADRTVDLDYRARLSAVGDAGAMAVKPGEVPGHFGASAGLNLYVPIYDGGRRQRAHDRIAVREESRKDYRAYYADQLRLRHALLAKSMVQTDSLLEAARRQSSDEEQLIALYRQELEHGLVRLTDLFLVLENHTRTVNDLVQAQADRWRIINALIHLQ